MVIYTLAISGKTNLVTLHGLECNVCTATASERRGKTKFIDLELSLALGGRL